MDILISIANILLSPFSFFFLFLISGSAQNQLYESVGTNTNRLRTLPFIVFISSYLAICLILLHAYSLVAPTSFEIWKVFIPTHYWLSILCWLITVFTYKTYFQGMEGNIMGFVFFPMILVGSGALIFVNISSFFSNFPIHTPVVVLPIWLKIIFLGFSPLMVAMFSAQPKEKEDATIWTLLIANYIFLSMIFAFHWIVFKLFERPLSFDTFFVSDSSILFHLPFLGGMIHFIYFTLVKKEYVQKTLFYGIPNILITLISCFSIVLQMINYVTFLKTVW